MDTLKRIFAQEETVLFIGSGISTWSGLPSWTELIEELAQFIETSGAKADLVRAEAQKGDLLQAASCGFDQLTKQQIGEFVRDACRYGVAKPHEILHRKIVSLGPRCFITTNYDNLIEESLRKWQPNRFYRPPVTNRHLTETAEIIQVRAIDFIFKPHGDAGDIESIILTREQYSQLLPQGERRAALESLKMLLATRPVVYLGFGLCDPDFLYVRGVLANTYKGGTRDHYAIMPDIPEAKRDCWRRNYGIHLVSYTTTELPDKTRDHTALLTLLDSFLEKEPGLLTAVDFDPHTPDVVLALTRHAAGLSRTPKLTPEFQIRVHAEQKGDFFIMDRFEHSPVEKFLDDGPERAVLTGQPGAGKTYALRRSAARLADKLHESCLSELFDAKSLVVPILADLKLYRGDLAELVSQELPRSLPLDEVTQCFKVKIFLDSFNEMPREYRENSSYEADFAAFITKIGDSSLIISSRTNDGLDKLGFPVYSLDQIDEADIAAELQGLGIEIQGPFFREVQSLLQRPFYFQQVASGTIKLPKELLHPRDLYRVFFENLCGRFETRFSVQLDIERLLSRVAYNALNRGEEAFPLSELLRILETSAETLELVGIDAREIANWLVSASVLIPYTRGRIAFVHQSVTEYLAASELARRYQSNPGILDEKLSTTRWDQALFMTLGLLPEALAERFLNDTIKVDFALALRAAKYLEVGREEVVSKLLSEIPERIQALERSDFDIGWIVESHLPLTDAHEAHLRTLIGLGGMIGAAGVCRLVELKGEGVKDELLQLLVDRCDDYNLCCNGIARALKPFATDEDAKKVAAWADSIQTPPDDDLDGFISGAAEFLSRLDLSVIRREFVPADRSKEISIVRRQVICEILQKYRSTAALNLAGELLCRGITEAATAIYFISNFAKPDSELSWDSYGPDHVRHLLSILGTGRSFALDALKCLCAGRSDLSEVIRQEASKKSGIEKAVLMHCVSPADFAPVFQALGELVEMGDEQRREQPLQILDGFKYDWTGQEELFVQLLRLRDVRLAALLLGGANPPLLPGLSNLNIGPIHWWLEWMMEVSASGSNMCFLDDLGGLFSKHLNRDVQRKFVLEFNKPSSKFRLLLFQFVLPHFTDITTDMFSEDAISFLLATLSEEGSASHFRGHPLGRTATEEFVTERLLPLLSDTKQPFLRNLRTVLRQAGSRHGRRYFVKLPA